MDKNQRKNAKITCKRGIYQHNEGSSPLICATVGEGAKNVSADLVLYGWSLASMVIYLEQSIS